MKKLVVRFLMLLFVLGMSVNAAWADMGGLLEELSESNPEAAQQLITVLSAQTYCAQLTGHESSTGGGKVYVNTSGDPRETEYVEGTSNVAVNGMGMSMSGMTKIGIKAWAKPEEGYWFAGFSSSNMGVDLGRGNDGMYEGLYDIGVREGETIEHVIYATFEPIRFVSYEISGITTTADDGAGNMTCDLAAIFTLSGAEEDIDDTDFSAPIVSGEGWSLTNWDYNTSNAGKVTVNVHFTTTNTDPADYSGTVVLETKAGVKMTANLNARTPSSSTKDFSLYNGKAFVGAYDFSALSDLNLAGYANPIIKLNSGYNSAITINKSLTLDLNGYDMLVNGTAITVANNATLTLAYSPYNDTEHGRIIGLNNDGKCISVEAGSKLILNGGTIFNANNAIVVAAGAELVQNGANILGANNAIYSQGAVTTIDGNIKGRIRSLGSDAELIINGGTFDNVSETINAVSFATGIAIQIDGGTAQIKKGNVVGQTFGVQSAGTTTIEKLAYIRGAANQALSVTGGTTTVQCGKFDDPYTLSNVSGGTLVFQSAYFKENSTNMTAVAGKPIWRNTSGPEFREDYTFFAGVEASAKEAGVSMCHIGAVSYSSLEEALAYANNASEKVLIVMDNNYTLPAGYYTLPSNATLLIPKSNDQTAETSVVEREKSYVKPSLFRKLTLEDGVNLDVFGTIEVSGTQYSALSARTGSVTGLYAQLQMNAGSKIILQNNSHFRAWGYVTGDVARKDAQYHVPMGEIDARRGATVYELFQMGDWGNTMMNALGLVTNDTRFPINTYFIQNIEVPTKYHAGARLTTATSVSADLSGANVKMCANDIQIIGVTNVDVAMFLMDQEADAENTWVRKWYDTSTDQQVYEVNSAAHIGNLVINLASSPLLNGLESTLASGAFGEEMQGIGQFAIDANAHFEQDLVMNSGQYVLPITYNFKLHLLSGTLDFTQNTAFIPGSELEIDKEATVSVTDPNDYEDPSATRVLAGSLYIYDANTSDWPNTAAKVSYSPTFGGTVPDAVRDISSLEDAKINVHGTFDTSVGYIFTSEHGGNIFSSVEDAGTFMFSVDAKTDEEAEVVKVTTSQTTTFYPAYLRNSQEYIANGGDEYTHTSGTAAGQSFCFIDFDGTGGQWKSLTQVDCFVKDEHNIYYAKPQEYVALANGGAENDDHTYSDLAGAGRLFILITDDEGLCHWWEVEAKKNYFHCIHPENDTYYEWDNAHSEWKEKKFTITWKDKNWGINDAEDKVLQTYAVPYRTQAEWLSTNPTRPASTDYTYDFTGWTPALGPVTSDVTYTATYEAKQIKYTITFVNDGGVEIERHLLARNEMPVCENVPTRTGYTLEWSPALAAVTGNQTYTATWLPEPPTKYEIKFMDYDGTTELQIGNVAVGSVPTPPVDPTGKPATTEYTYVFDHWSPALEEVSATSAKVYTAVYREEAQTYTISYFKEDGVTPNPTKASETLIYGATPTPPAVSKESPVDGHTYTLVWKTTNGAKGIETVTADASYKPTYTDAINKYQVSVMSNPSGACTISGAGIYDYNTSATAVTITITPNSGYTFTGWSDGLGGTNTTRQMAITDDINLVANFNVEDADYTITWNNEDGSLIYEMGQKANTATIFTGATPTKGGDAQYSYIFDGWVTDMDYPAEGEFYKNNMTPKATEPATYYAHFTPVVNQYTIYWKNEAGTADIEVDYDQPYGTAIAYNSAIPTKQATAAATYTFDGWSTTVDGDVVTLPAAVGGDATYYAHFAATPKTYTITWKRDDGTLIESSEEEYGAILSPADPTKPATAVYTYEFIEWSPVVAEVTGVAVYTALFDAIPLTSDLEIGVGESEDLDDGVVERTNLVITSNGVASGQLFGAANLTITGDAIFRLEQDFAAATWYAVAVPWTVDPATGIYNASGVQLPTGDVYVIEFDANAYASANRESGRTDYWKFLDVTGNDMEPGKLYMVYLAAATNALEFHKKAGASLWTTSTSVTTASGSVTSQENWNAIANPALYYANLSTGATDVLKYNGNDAYVVASSTNMVVGQPIFAQVSTPSTVVAAPVGGGAGMPAYRRAMQAGEANSRFVVELTQNGKLADRLIVQTAEEKANEYVIGMDLAKMSVSTKVAQMYVERYNTKLCKNTVEMTDGGIDYPTAICAPIAGDYVLAAEQQGGENVLYLTRNGEAIWDLSESDFVLSLEQGTTYEYGLRVSARAPQTPTGIDEAIVDSKSAAATKVLMNNTVYIIREGRIYSIHGQLVK